MRPASVISALLLAVMALLLSSPARAQLVATDNAYTQQNSATTNTAGGNNLFVRGSTTADRNTYVRFNLSALPSGLTASNISTATMMVFANGVNTAGTFDVYLVTGAWTEATVTYRTDPALGTKIASAVSVTTATS